MKKSAYRKWIFPVLVVFLLVVAFIIRKYKKQETEYFIMQAVSQAYADTFEKAQVMPSGVSVMLTYKEPAWPEDQSCLIRIDSFYLSGFDTNTETIEKYILNEVSKYQKRLQQTDP